MSVKEASQYYQLVLRYSMCDLICDIIN